MKSLGFCISTSFEPGMYTGKPICLDSLEREIMESKALFNNRSCRFSGFIGKKDSSPFCVSERISWYNFLLSWRAEPLNIYTGLGLF